MSKQAKCQACKAAATLIKIECPPFPSETICAKCNTAWQEFITQVKMPEKWVRENLYTSAAYFIQERDSA